MEKTAEQITLGRIFRGARGVYIPTRTAHQFGDRAGLEKLRSKGKIRTREQKGNRSIPTIFCNAEDVLRYAREPRSQRV